MMKKSSFIQSLLGSIVGGVILIYMEPFLPESPGGIMFILYSVIMPLVTIAFGIAMVAVLCRVLWGIWKLLTDRGQQHNVWDKVRRWPTSKRDAIIAMVLVWTIAIYAFLSVLIFTVPRGRFTGQELSGTTLGILLLTVTPISVLAYWHIGEVAIHVWHKWKSETSRGRFWIAVAVIAFIFVFALMAWGDVAGWDEKAWFATAQR